MPVRYRTSPRRGKASSKRRNLNGSSAGKGQAPWDPTETATAILRRHYFCFPYQNVGDELSWGQVVGDELSVGQLTGDELT